MFGTRNHSIGGCLNRTFMELKCESQARTIWQDMVLIEPLWN